MPAYQIVSSILNVQTYCIHWFLSHYWHLFCDSVVSNMFCHSSISYAISFIKNIRRKWKKFVYTLSTKKFWKFNLRMFFENFKLFSLNWIMLKYQICLLYITMRQSYKINFVLKKTKLFRDSSTVNAFYLNWSNL